ncbi:MAG: hypothetical protein ABFS28_08485 [Bacteroidota bacterium]
MAINTARTAPRVCGIATKSNITREFRFEKYIKLEESVKALFYDSPIIYNMDKKKYATEISKYITDSDLFNLDLYKKVESLSEIIESWNK